MISSIFDLVESDFEDKHILSELNLFMNDYCRSHMEPPGMPSNMHAGLFELCSKLGFLTSRGTWRGGEFDAYALKTLFTHSDFQYLKEQFELWQYSNQLDDVTTCR